MASGWITQRFEIRSDPNVLIGILTKCFCGKRMKERDSGWYCRRHGLQAYIND